MKRVEKAFAYITSRGRLLVFDHVDFPEAGVQVPAGTIHLGEPPELAALREAQEETGLQRFGAPRALGIAEFDARPFGKAEIHRRHFFHLPAEGDLPERWRHEERHASDGSAPIRFELYWLPPADAALCLIGDHGRFIPALVADPDGSPVT